MMNSQIFSLAGIFVFGGLTVCAAGTNAGPSVVTVNVPGNSNPWLAQCRDGTFAGARYDVAPNQSPIEMTGISTNGPTFFTFTVSGGVTHDPALPLSDPDGNFSYIWSRNPGPENGIGDITVPAGALIGVFVDESNSRNESVPSTLDFGNPVARDFLALSPGLRQPFFIGDGRASNGQVQKFVPPSGATRLVLGSMDSYGWMNNQGSFTVEIKVNSADTSSDPARQRE